MSSETMSGGVPMPANHAAALIPPRHTRLVQRVLKSLKARLASDIRIGDVAVESAITRHFLAGQLGCPSIVDRGKNQLPSDKAGLAIRRRFQGLATSRDNLNDPVEIRYAHLFESPVEKLLDGMRLANRTNLSHAGTRRVESV